MADLSDVITALVTIAAGALYPNGTSAACAAGLPVMVYEGWPIPSQLDIDIAASKAHVSVFPRPEERNTTRYPKEWQEVSNNGTTGQSIMEVRRQERVFQITIWAPTPTARNAIARIIDPLLANTPRITLSDTTVARLTYRSSPITDTDQKEKIYRRDLLYTVEYATTITETDYAVLENDINITAGQVGEFEI